MRPVSLLRALPLLAFLTIGEALAQVKTVSMPDYFPFDQMTSCPRTFTWTYGRTGQTRSEIIGSMTVPYKSGPLTGPLMCEAGPGDHSLSTWINDGTTVKNLMDSDHYPSTDRNLTAFPPENAFGMIQDRQYMLPAILDWYEIKKGLTFSYVGGDRNDTYWFRIQDVTVQGRIYPDAVIMWGFEGSNVNVPLNLHGKDAELGFTPPTAADTGGLEVDMFLIFAKGVGLIASGSIDNNGELVALSELTSISCHEKAPAWDAFDVPGTRITRAQGGNERGDIVGEYQQSTTSDPVRGFLRNKRGELTIIDYPGAVSTSPRDINNRGDIAGAYRILDSSTSTVRSHGFVLAGGSFTSIDFPGAVHTQALGVDSRGDVVGTYFLQTEHGFLRRNGVFSTVDFPGAARTRVLGINENGDMVGRFGTSSEGVALPHGFLLSDGVYTAIDIPGAQSTEARGINATGDIVGTYVLRVLQPNGVTLSLARGFRLSNGVFETIEAPCSFQTALSDITNQGDIIGEFVDSPYLETPPNPRPNGAWYGFRVSPK
jgi:hypothetical protein